MLNNLYTVFLDKFIDPVVAWDRYLEFIAADHVPKLLFELEHNFEWYFADSQFMQMSSMIYNPRLLWSDYYDHLGDLYTEKVISDEKNTTNMHTKQPSQLIEKLFCHSPSSQLHRPISILDSNTGSGRMLMEIYKRFPNYMLFGIEKDIRLSRIALTNIFIHDIPGLILNADIGVHEVDLSTAKGQHNWRYYNRWKSCKDKLKKIAA